MDRRQVADGPGQRLDEGPELVEPSRLPFEAGPLPDQPGDRTLGLEDGLDGLEEAAIVEGPELLDELPRRFAPAD